MLCNILLLNFQIIKIWNTCVFYMHMVMRYIGALGVSHNARVNWPQRMHSQLDHLVAGENNAITFSRRTTQKHPLIVIELSFPFTCGYIPSIAV